VRPAVLTQRWRDVTFLHWPLDPADAAPLLPPGIRPDVHEGRTFLGVVALEMAATRLAGGPPVPGTGAFGQVNVRLYSVDDAGRRGVFFLRLTAGRTLPALAGRFLGLPYAADRVVLERSGDRRGFLVGDSSRVDVRVGPAREPGELESFVTARWGLHVRVAGRTGYAGVEHEPWPLHDAELLGFDGGLVADAGLPDIAGPPVSVLWSPGVDARIGPVR
jgi:uncharacterized protein YqjF (DUF2071 family)